MSHMHINKTFFIQVERISTTLLSSRNNVFIANKHAKQQVHVKLLQGFYSNPILSCRHMTSNGTYLMLAFRLE